MHSRPNIRLFDVNDQVRLHRRLVRIVNASEALDLSLSGLGIDASLVCPFAVLQWRRDMHEIERPILLDNLPRLLSLLLERCYRGCNDSRSGLCELRCYERDTADVLVAVLPAEA